MYIKNYINLATQSSIKNFVNLYCSKDQHYLIAFLKIFFISV